MTPMTAVERGSALVLALLTLTLLAGVGLAVTMTASTETLIAASFRSSEQARYAADAAVEWALVDLGTPGLDWSAVASGTIRSAFVDGVADGLRSLGDGTSLDLGALVAANRPFVPYAHGRLAAAVTPPGFADFGVPGFYLVVLVAADPAAPGRLGLRAEAFGPRGAHKSVMAGLSRSDAGVHLDRWTQIR